MDALAKRACNNTRLQPVTGLDTGHTGWGVYMRKQRITGHTKSHILEQIQIDRLVECMDKKPYVAGNRPEEISIRHMLGTAPDKNATTHEAMYMWHELPTNNRTNEWNICDAHCVSCHASNETYKHWLHECEITAPQRRICSTAILQLYTEYGANPTLQDATKSLYGTKTNGTTRTYDENTMPDLWKTAYNSCPQNGHVYKESMIQGLAAETVILLGDTACLWNGVVTRAMVKMMTTGGIPEYKTRELTKEIRGVLWVTKNAMWRVRNRLNFAEDIERHRLTQRQLNERIAEHIRCNDKAQRDLRTVQGVADMGTLTREKWMIQTMDDSRVQRTMDEYIQRTSNDTRTAIPMPDTVDREDVMIALSQSLPREPGQRKIAQMFQTTAVDTERVKPGKMKPRRHAKIVADTDKKQRTALQTFKPRKSWSDPLRPRAAARSSSDSVQLAPQTKGPTGRTKVASKLGDQECRGGQSTTRSARPATKDRRRASSRDAGVAMQCGIRTATAICGGTAVEKDRSTGNVMNACRKR